MLSCTKAPTLLALYQCLRTSPSDSVSASPLTSGSPLRPDSPLTPKTVIVPNHLVGQWLSQQDALETGIVANRRYALPSAWVWEVLRPILPEATADRSDFEGLSLTLRVFEALMDDAWLADFPRLQTYCNHALANDRLADVMTLASKIAEVFDRYQHYRTDWLDDWQAQTGQPRGVELTSEDADWQAAMWQRLLSGEQWPRHRLLQQGLKRLAQDSALRAQLPKSMTLFGITHLSPLLSEVLQSLSDWVDIRMYWLDVRAPDLPHWCISLGAFSNIDAPTADMASRPNNALGRLQASLLDDAPVDSDPTHTTPDHSLCVVSAHSAMREVEAVYDFIADALQSPDLQTADIAIGVADLETYAPCIRAVFGTDNRIPYQLCDALVSQESLLLDGLQTLLTLPRWRFTREEVMSLLNNRLVLRRFGLEKSDIDTVNVWLDNTRVHWGIDGTHKQSLGLPATEQHTWRQGLDRIFLGFAVAPTSDAGLPPLVGQYAPMDDIESADVLRFSRFVAYCDALIAWRTTLLSVCPLREWVGRLRDLTAVFFAVDEGEVAAESVLLQHLDALQEAAEPAPTVSTAFDLSPIDSTAVTHPLDAKAMSVLLQEGLANTSGGARLSGGVNIAKITTLAGLPFKQVCLLGLGLDQWPTQDDHLGFDLLAQSPRPSDRQRAQDDRHTLLLWLACAQTGLYLSYQGQRLDKHQTRPPSVLVSELQHYCQQHQIPVLERQYGMHPFSVVNFSPEAGPWQSHSGAWCEAAKQAGQGTEHALPLFPPAQTDTPLTDALRSDLIEVDELLRFYRHPQRAFLHRLGLYPEGASDGYENSEPFTLANFTDQRLREQLLHDSLAAVNHDLDQDDALARASASGILPQGEVGALLFEEEYATTMTLRASVAEVWAECDVSPTPIHLHLEFDDHKGVTQDDHSVEVSGLLTVHKHPSLGVIEVLAGKLYNHQRVDYWLRHLLINASDSSSHPLGIDTCIYIGDAPHEPIVFPALAADAARDQLAEWIRGFVLGQDRPLPFHPKLSMTYWQATLDEKQDATQAVWALWVGDYNRAGMGANAEMQYLYRAGSPVDSRDEPTFAAFREWAERLLAGMESKV